MLGSIGYFAVGSIGKLPLITMIFEKLVKPLKNNKTASGGYRTPDFCVKGRSPNHSTTKFHISEREKYDYKIIFFGF